MGDSAGTRVDEMVWLAFDVPRKVPALFNLSILRGSKGLKENQATLGENEESCSEFGFEDF